MSSSEIMEGVETMKIDSVPLPTKPKFNALMAHEMYDGKVQFRKVSVPNHRFTPLKKCWMDIYTPVFDQMKIDLRMNLRTRKVELKTRADTPDVSNLQKCADFVQAFMLGFDIIDAIALLRLDELYVESFEIKDVKTLKGDHQARAIGRLSGKNGKTKIAIENSTRTRIVIADTKIHILGSFANIKIARDSLCSLILGSPAGKHQADRIWGRAIGKIAMEEEMLRNFWGYKVEETFPQVKRVVQISARRENVMEVFPKKEINAGCKVFGDVEARHHIRISETASVHYVIASLYHAECHILMILIAFDIIEIPWNLDVMGELKT